MRKAQAKAERSMNENEARAALRRRLNEAEEAVSKRDARQEPIPKPSRPIRKGDLVELPAAFILVLLHPTWAFFPGNESCIKKEPMMNQEYTARGIAKYAGAFIAWMIGSGKFGFGMMPIGYEHFTFSTSAQ